MISSKAITLFFSCLMISACASTPTTNESVNRTSSATPEATPAVQPSVDLMATGRKLFVDNCAICHKESGKGGKVEIEGRTISPDDLTTQKMKDMPDDKMHRYIFDGIADEGMPAFKEKLSEAEIREVVRYIRAELQK